MKPKHYESILWKRLDIPGHEVAEQRQTVHGWQLRGVAVFAHEERPCRLEYDIRCGGDWQTELVTLAANVGEQTVALELLRNPAGEWSMHGSKVWELTDCDDIDLNFSPSTNMLPIRRLGLDVGECARPRCVGTVPRVQPRSAGADIFAHRGGHLSVRERRRKIPSRSDGGCHRIRARISGFLERGSEVRGFKIMRRTDIE